MTEIVYKVLSSGTTPRLIPRPPFKAHDILYKALLSGIRQPLLMAAFCYSVAPIYFSLASYWKEKGLSDESFFMVGTSLIHFVLYCCINGFFLLCDTKGYLQNYRLYRNNSLGYTSD